MHRGVGSYFFRGGVFVGFTKAHWSHSVATKIYTPCDTVSTSTESYDFMKKLFTFFLTVAGKVDVCANGWLVLPITGHEGAEGE